MEKIEINSRFSKSEIYVGEGALSRLQADADAFVVTDSNVEKLHAAFFQTYFKDRPVFVLPAGEENKNFRMLGEILTAMSEAGVGRMSTLYAVGGGVVGDLGGLAAAIYMRGIDLVQIPTTLLAQADSGIGGKTAIDFHGVKNLVGAFHNPKEVLIDPSFLKTLPAREWKCGLGEIVKYAALDKAVFALLKNRLAEDFDKAFLTSLIPECVNIKARVVAEDERESGVRKSLNVGHTAGHAVELFSSLSHGESVLWGMAFETVMATKAGIAEKSYGDALLKLVLSALQAPPAGEFDVTTYPLWAERAKSDKKNSEDKIGLALPKAEGKWTFVKWRYEEYYARLEEAAKELKARL